jgi:hypothetical protein
VEEIICLQAEIDQSCEDLLTLREKMTKAGIPTYQLGSSIRELQEVRNLLVLSAFKKYRSSHPEDEKEGQKNIEPARSWEEKWSWRVSFGLFLQMCRILISKQLRASEKEKQFN